MKNIKSLLLVLCTLVFASCTNTTKTNQSADKKTLVDSMTQPVEKDKTSDNNDGCTGGLPNTPTVDSIQYPNRKFRFIKRLGITEFETNDGDNITIEHSNCDYSTYHFIITTNRFDPDLSDTSHCANITADLIEKIKPAIIKSIDVRIDSGLLYLRKYYSEKGKPLNHEIDFNDNPEYSWRNVVIVDGISKVKDRYVFAVTFYMGPL